MRLILSSAALIAGLAALPAYAQEPGDFPKGLYTLDPSHSSVIFEVRHLGLSNFTASFDSVSGTLEIDPASPTTATLETVIETRSLDLPAPPEGFFDEMMSPVWFNADAHPEIRFQSESVTLTGDDTADVAGLLTLLGQAVPVTLATTFNAGFPAGVIEPHARLGFSAVTRLQRSEFGMSFGVPPEGSDFGVGDLIEIRIEAEFTGPPS